MTPPDDWTSTFVNDGFAHFSRLIDERTISKARSKIDGDLARNYDPARKAEYDYRSFCPDILGSREIMALLKHPDVQMRISTLLSSKEIGSDDGQVAIRKAHNAEHNEAPSPHIDGIPTAHNGVSGDEITPFSLLVGIFLSDVKVEFAGNFTVWPGSHRLLERYFHERGPMARREGMPATPRGEPRQLLCSSGDVVLCHYLLAHGAAVNTSDNDRYAVFFRLAQRELDRNFDPNFRENGWTHLTKMWTGWKVAAA